MGEIYEKMDNMLGEIRDIMVDGKHAEEYSLVEDIILARWEKMNIPLHCLGFALTPRFYDHRYLAMPAPGGTNRKSPNQDKEVIKGVMQAFDKITEDAKEAQMLREQYAVFHSQKGIYVMAAAQTDAVSMDAIDWWSTYGSETPELAEIAKKVQKVLFYQLMRHGFDYLFYKYILFNFCFNLFRYFLNQLLVHQLKGIGAHIHSFTM